MADNNKVLRVGKEGSLKREDYATLRHRKDPCVKEHDMALKCLDDGGYDRSKCEDFFTNYRNCRKFWKFVSDDRRKKGITPYLPPPEEREQVKTEYLHQLHDKL
ncbi:coiled-coil-helix-coiled-coil-helix domain-containing protein 7 [Aplysia californica]|uniref:Coiled-coil-helix-coiled-coil-helix domain-containing protein 7 n=1 Tax=Aplysia californica TaxID=6500 RepID=A0ABM0JXI8_APLCA|nr:coiled-coil-helix-coiled-coil-helix domain-containing protein 7 [Aplysia californica]